MNRARQPKGVPVGGQFAAGSHSEPPVGLNPAYTHYLDTDGTQWETRWEDDYSETISSNIGMIEIYATHDVRTQDVSYEAVDFRSGGRPVRLGRGSAPTMDEAKTEAKVLRERANEMGFNGLQEGSRTPWGKAQAVDNVVPGIDAVFTAGHGGYKLTTARNKDVDPVWRQRSGWYEEDCAFAIAVVTHHQDMDPKMVELAHQEARRWYPDQYEKAVGGDPAKYGVTDYRPVQPDESHIRAEQDFWAKHASDHFRISSGRDSEEHPGMVEAVVREVPAGDVEGTEGTEQVYLVPKEQYMDCVQRNRFALPKNGGHRLLS